MDHGAIKQIALMLILCITVLLAGVGGGTMHHIPLDVLPFGGTTTIHGIFRIIIFTALITTRTAMVGDQDGDTEIHGIMATIGIHITPGGIPNVQPTAGLTEDAQLPE